jgi:membrane protein
MTAPVLLSSLGAALKEGALSSRISLGAAGCAFYAMLALFPLLSLLVTLYGAALDPATVEPQLATLSRLLPEDAYALIADRLTELALAPRPTLGMTAAVSLAIAAWSGSAGIRALLSALTLLRGEEDTRGMLAFYGTALAMTVVAVLAVAVAIAGLVLSLPVLPLLGVREDVIGAIRSLTVLPALGFVFGAIALLYRYGPDGPRARWGEVMPGAGLATMLWAAASALFSVYARQWGEYDRIYGSLGAAMALLMWFYVGTFAVLLGMAWNVALAKLRAREAKEREGAA